uniref:ATP synthase subunit a n=1 Tax=Ophiophthalmus serratus TaxID=2993811 RepID=A0A9E8IDK1_9ECHI|nr:ATP synthase F0 subunit 6 [Ophiophthalmus serratus]UZG65883.1 ATP synthase F0 subunit 6 [Ophiophthalmus serratus]
MNLNINNIFVQFNTPSLLLIPLTLIGGFIAITWLFFINSSHWANSRLTIVNIINNALFSNLISINNSDNNSWNLWIFSIFLLFISFNLMSLIPYTLSQTSHLSFTFALSLPIWTAFNIKGLKLNWQAKLSHLLPQGTPTLLIPLMIIIETISLFIQPITLGFRLGANLLAGHLLIFLCACVIWELTTTFPQVGPTPFILIITLLILETAVACIQAAVFLILSKNYLSNN